MPFEYSRFATMLVYLKFYISTGR